MSSRQPQYQPGQIIPGTVYRVHRVIGAGGMGTVYDVEDTTVGKRYVLKTLHANLSDRDDLAGRLLREARALARMHHPSIVEVFTAGTTTDQLRLPFYVMEKLNGQSLRQVLTRKARLEVDQALDIGIDLLDALDHAHELGMVHRDVKPDNIYLHKAIDGSHVAKLLDFGIAKIMASSTQLTGGRFIGTFRYASPEQILGGELGPSSDLYSAALTIYEMTAGRGPFDDFAGEIEIGKAHAGVQAPRLSRFAKVPQQLDDLIASALDKKPANRPKDAFKFASVLREMKQGLRASIPNGPPSQQITAKPIQTGAATAVAPAMLGQMPETHAAITPRLEGPPSDKPTQIASPQAQGAATEVAPSSSSKPDSTTNPYGPAVLDGPRSAPGTHQHTMRIGQAHTLQDGAPAPMTVLPNLGPQQGPTPAPPPVIDRRAETHVSAPEPAAGAGTPQHDTVMLAHLAAPQAHAQQGYPPSVEVRAPTPTPEPGVSTFAAQTTDTPQRPRNPVRAIALAAIGFFVLLVVGIVLIVALKKKPVESSSSDVTRAVATNAPSPTPSPSPSPSPTEIAITPPVATSNPAPVTTPSTTTNANATTASPSPSPTPSPSLSTRPTATQKRDVLHVGSGL